MNTSKSRLLFELLFVILACTLAACGAKQPLVASPTSTGAAQVEITHTLEGKPTATVQPSQERNLPTQTATPEGVKISRDVHLDPALKNSQDEILVNQYLYEELFRLDENGVLQPALAESWLAADDGLSFIIHVRQKVTFHDGSPLDADSVLANLNRWFDPHNPLRGKTGEYQAWKEFFGGFKGEKGEGGQPLSPVDGFEKENDFTLIIHLNRPAPNLLKNLAQAEFAIVCPGVLLRSGDFYGTRNGGAVGTGAYMLAEWTDVYLVLVPNPNYWGELPEKPLRFYWH